MALPTPKAGVPAPIKTPTETEINMPVTPVFVGLDGKRVGAAKNRVLCRCLQLIKERILLEVPLTTLQHNTATFQSVKLYLERFVRVCRLVLSYHFIK